MWGTWTLRWGAALAISLAATAACRCVSVHGYDVALRRCFQVTEELVWELFTQAGPVGEPHAEAHGNRSQHAAPCRPPIDNAHVFQCSERVPAQG